MSWKGMRWSIFNITYSMPNITWVSKSIPADYKFILWPNVRCQFGVCFLSFTWAVTEWALNTFQELFLIHKVTGSHVIFCQMWILAEGMNNSWIYCKLLKSRYFILWFIYQYKKKTHSLTCYILLMHHIIIVMLITICYAWNHLLVLLKMFISVEHKRSCRWVNINNLF